MARAAVRADVFGNAGGATRPFLVVVCLVTVVHAWWDYFAALLGVTSLIAPRLSRLLVMVDVALFFGGIWWVKRVCTKTVREEEDWLEAQQRKDD